MERMSYLLEIYAEKFKGLALPIQVEDIDSKIIKIAFTNYSIG